MKLKTPWLDPQEAVLVLQDPKHAVVSHLFLTEAVSGWNICCVESCRATRAAEEEWRFNFLKHEITQRLYYLIRSKNSHFSSLFSKTNPVEEGRRGRRGREGGSSFSPAGLAHKRWSFCWCTVGSRTTNKRKPHNAPCSEAAVWTLTAQKVNNRNLQSLTPSWNLLIKWPQIKVNTCISGFTHLLWCLVDPDTRRDREGCSGRLKGCIQPLGSG